MKAIPVIFIVLVLIIVIYFFILGVKSKSGTAPGLYNDQLILCPKTPNCINSEFAEDQSHFISPIKLNIGSGTDPMAILKSIIRNMGGEIIKADENYLAATFTSRIFRFVDDLEIRIDHQQHLIHIRSASRVGRSDLGVNLKRVKLLKEKLTYQNSSATQP